MKWPFPLPHLPNNDQCPSNSREGNNGFKHWMPAFVLRSVPIMVLIGHLGQTIDFHIFQSWCMHSRASLKKSPSSFHVLLFQAIKWALHFFQGYTTNILLHYRLWKRLTCFGSKWNEAPRCPEIKSRTRTDFGLTTWKCHGLWLISFVFKWTPTNWKLVRIKWFSRE